MILIIINSIVGKKGNIGYRLQFTLDEFERKSLDYMVISRGSIVRSPKIIRLGFFGFLSRVINSLRKYFFKGFDSRKYDIFLFNFCVFFLLIFKRKRVKQTKLVYLFESSSRITKYFKSRRIPIVVDVPIAPTEYAYRLESMGIPAIKGSPFLRREELSTYLNATHIICPSEYVKAEIIRLLPRGKKVISVIPFGVQSGIKEIVRVVDSDNKSGYIFSFIGNISSRKGALNLIDAWGDWPFPEDKLIFQGRLYPEVRQRLNRVKPTESLITRPFGETEYLLEKTDIFVFPSLMEGSAKVNYEAMSKGIPIVTTIEAGPPFVDGQCGILVPANSPNELRRAMLKLRNSPELRKSYGFSSLALSKKLSWKNYSRKTVGVLLKYHGRQS